MRGAARIQVTLGPQSASFTIHQSRRKGDVMHMSGAAELIRAETGSLIKYFIQLTYSIFTFKFNINLRIYLNTHRHTHTSLEEIFTTCTPISNFFSLSILSWTPVTTRVKEIYIYLYNSRCRCFTNNSFKI